MVRRRQRIPPNPRYAGIRVDANFFHDTIPTADRVSADRLIDLAENQRISLAIPHTVIKELEHPNTPQEARRRAARLVYTLDLDQGDARRREAVRVVMQGNAASGRHQRDADHLYDAALWGCSYFITCDERIHRKAGQFGEIIPGLWIMKPSQMLDLVLAALQEPPEPE